MGFVHPKDSAFRFLDTVLTRCNWIDKVSGSVCYFLSENLLETLFFWFTWLILIHILNDTDQVRRRKPVVYLYLRVKLFWSENPTVIRFSLKPSHLSPKHPLPSFDMTCCPSHVLLLLFLLFFHVCRARHQHLFFKAAGGRFDLHMFMTRSRNFILGLEIGKMFSSPPTSSRLVLFLNAALMLSL